MIDDSQVASIGGTAVLDPDGTRIGKAGQVYLDDSTGAPSWVTVNTGLFGTSESFVPLEGATLEGSELRVAYPRSMVKDAPKVAADGHLDIAEEVELYRFYGLGGDDTTVTDRARTVESTRPHGTADATRRPGVDDGTHRSTDDAMTRSEEHLVADVERIPVGRARLRKFVTTEQQTVTVPVTREQLRIEREPIDVGTVGAGPDSPVIAEEEHEVVLSEERAVVTKQTVPVERVRVDKEVVVEQQTLSGEVRTEHIELETVDGEHAQPNARER